MDTAKLPNSELMFQISKQQFDSVSDVQFVIRHPINQKRTVAMMTAAHASKSIKPTDMASWAVSDGDMFFSLLGIKNVRPTVFMSKIFTWAQLPSSNARDLGAMILQLGPTTDC
jgi:hypothetical protein